MNLKECYQVTCVADDESFIRDFSSRGAWGIWTGIDMFDCDPALVRSAEQIGAFVKGLCDYIEMKRFGDPVIVHFGDSPRVAGYSMSQLIETSLISGHFVELDNSVYIDVFSCKQYYPYRTAQYCSEFFKARSFNVHASLRGAGQVRKPLAAI